jgi:hypothetical protein
MQRLLLKQHPKGIIRNKRYRNRRIDDFLKELDMTEGRGTGIPIIRKEMAGIQVVSQYDNASQYVSRSVLKHITTT